MMHNFLSAYLAIHWARSEKWKFLDFFCKGWNIVNKKNDEWRFHKVHSIVGHIEVLI